MRTHTVTRMYASTVIRSPQTLWGSYTIFSLFLPPKFITHPQFLHSSWVCKYDGGIHSTWSSLLCTSFRVNLLLYLILMFNVTHKISGLIIIFKEFSDVIHYEINYFRNNINANRTQRFWKDFHHHWISCVHSKSNSLLAEFEKLSKEENRV